MMWLPSSRTWRISAYLHLLSWISSQHPESVLLHRVMTSIGRVHFAKSSSSYLNYSPLLFSCWALKNNKKTSAAFHGPRLTETFYTHTSRAGFPQGTTLAFAYSRQGGSRPSNTPPPISPTKQVEPVSHTKYSQMVVAIRKPSKTNFYTIKGIFDR